MKKIVFITSVLFFLQGCVSNSPFVNSEKVRDIQTADVSVQFVPEMTYYGKSRKVTGLLLGPLAAMTAGAASGETEAKTALTAAVKSCCVDIGTVVKNKLEQQLSRSGVQINKSSTTKIKIMFGSYGFMSDTGDSLFAFTIAGIEITDASGEKIMRQDANVSTKGDIKNSTLETYIANPTELKYQIDTVSDKAVSAIMQKFLSAKT